MSERMPDLAGRLRRHVADSGLFPEAGTALLAVSGGRDSVALAVLMGKVAAEAGLTLAVGHVDHGIMPGSDRVAADVAALAARLAVPSLQRTLALGPDASETAARRARYGALGEMRREIGARYLVTAHHADDQAETVLARALRGSGMAGLAGIPEQGPGGLVRPLLPFTRAELAAWLDGEGGGNPWPVHEDPANADPRHDRSWMRHRLMPLLRERLGAAAERRLLRLGRHAAAERRAWAAALRALPGLEIRVERGHAEVARAPLAAYDNMLSHELLRALGREAGCTLGPRRAARLAAFARTGTSGGTMPLANGWRAELVFDRLHLVRTRERLPAAPVTWTFEGEGTLRWHGWEIAWRVEPARVPERASFATWITPGPGTVRGLASGDRLVPLGGVGRRKARRLLMESRVPAGERDRYPIVARRDEVLWLPGVCRAAAQVPPPGGPAVRLEARGAGAGGAGSMSGSGNPGARSCGTIRRAGRRCTTNSHPDG